MVNDLRMSRLPMPDQPWPDAPAEWNDLTSRVIGCAIEVHRELGQGLPEKHYEAALMHELQHAGIPVERQHRIHTTYKSTPLPDLIVDILVKSILILELKAIDKVPDTHLAQLVSYLRATNLPLGLLINFNAPRLVDGIYRRINSAVLTHASPSAPPPRPLRSKGTA